MSFRKHLGWCVPQESWAVHKQTVSDRYGVTDLYAGIEAERIVLLWFEIEETDPSDLDLPTGTPAHTQKKKNSGTPLSEQEKEYVQVRFHPEIKERLSIAASEYDVNQGVLLGYVLREYYETDGWGRSIEAVGSDPSEPESTKEIPYGESEKADWIAEQIEPTDEILADDIREVIEEAGAASRVSHYLPLVLDRLGYVHHPNVEGIHIPQEALDERFGVSPTDPAFYRKPWSALSRSERIEGLEMELEDLGQPRTVSQIHDEIFGGEGSRNYIRDLANTVADSDGYEYKTSVGGTKRLRHIGSRSRSHSRSRSDPEGESEPEPEQEPTANDSEQEQERNRKEIETEAADEMAALMNASPETDGGIAATDGGEDFSG